MKKLSLISLCLIVSVSIFAQAPQALKYQAVVRNNDGSLVIDQSVTFRFTIIQDSALGAPVYSEIHSPTTNDFGMVNLVIGEGSTGDDFTTISWGATDHFLKVELDRLGGSSYEEMGTTQILSVPYALYAEKAHLADTANSALHADDIADNSVTSNKIVDGAVNSAEIAANAVTSAKIASNAVTSAKIAANAVNSSEIASGAVGSDELSSNLKVSFFARLTSTLILSTGDETIINFPEEYDDGKNYNPATGTFTVPYSGVYHISAAVEFSPILASAVRINIYLYKNGVRYIVNYASHDVAAGNAAYRNLSGTIKLTAGDELHIRAFQNSGSNMTIQDDYSFFSAFRVY